MSLLPSSFFDRPVLEVAHDLVGCYLVRSRMLGGAHGGKRVIERHMITETEAYDGEKDLACHASKGRTKRTEIMFGEAGRAYVYFVYGIHWLLNIVTGPEGYPAAVLIRGLEGMNGPAILTKKLGITGHLNGMKLGRTAGMWIEPRREKLRDEDISALPRIGVDYAGPIWAKKKWRFKIKMPSTRNA